MPGMRGSGGMWPWAMAGWVWLWALLILAIVAVVVWVAARAGAGSQRSDSDGSPDAMRILEERFARGEIDQEEFEARRATLRHGDP